MKLRLTKKLCQIFWATLYKKAREVTNSPKLPHHAPSPIATNFGVLGHVAYVINHVNLYLNRSKGYVPPRGLKSDLLN